MANITLSNGTIFRGVNVGDFLVAVLRSLPPQAIRIWTGPASGVPTDPQGGDLNAPRIVNVSLNDLSDGIPEGGTVVSEWPISASRGRVTLKDASLENVSQLAGRSAASYGSISEILEDYASRKISLSPANLLVIPQQGEAAWVVNLGDSITADFVIEYEKGETRDIFE